MRKVTACLLIICLAAGVLLGGFAGFARFDSAGAETAVQPDAANEGAAEGSAENANAPAEAVTGDEDAASGSGEGGNTPDATSGDNDDKASVDANNAPVGEPAGSENTQSADSDKSSSATNDAHNGTATDADATGDADEGAGNVDAVSDDAASDSANDDTVGSDSVIPVGDGTGDDTLADTPADTDADASTVEQTAPTEQAPATPTGDYGAGPAYVLDSGFRHYGELAELIPLGQTIYLYQRLVLEITGYTMEVLKDVRFAMDTDVFSSTDDQIYLSLRDPNGNAQSGVIYLWVGDKEQSTDNADRLKEVIDAQDEDILEREIQVTTEDYTADAPCTPSFTLTALPQIEAGMSFAVIVDEGEPQAISGEMYAPTVSGEYRFALLDESGAVLARSAKFAVALVDADSERNTATGDDANDDNANNTNGDSINANSNTDNSGVDDPDSANATPDKPRDEITIVPESAEETTDAILLDSGVQVMSVLGAAPVLAQAEIELTVTPEGYSGSAPSSTTPTFRLSGLPDGSYSYAVQVDGGAPSQVVGDAYTATQSGSYTLTFSIRDASDAAVATSREYPVSLDFTTSLVDQQAWARVDGAVVYGTLSDLLASSAKSIYIITGKTIVLGGGYTALSGRTLLPDPNVYGGGYTVKVSQISPEATGDNAIYVWVAAKGGGAATTATLTITPANYTANAWANKVPSFTLTSSPDIATLGGEYTYAVMIDGGAPILLGDGFYAPQDEGDYTLSFALVDADGAIYQQSQGYHVKLDFTAPLINISTSDRYSMKVVAGDTVSGGQGVSIDGGKRWSALTALSQGVSYRDFTATQAATFKPGEIVVRDAAGNTASNQNAITLYTTAANNRTGGTGGTGGSGGGSSSRTVSHASADTDELVAYNGVELILDDGSMQQLVVGDEALDLELYRDSFLVEDEEELEPPTFTASFTAWNGNEESGVDTLVLTASDDYVASETYSYTWEFSGVVYKKLAASGIDYLVLRIGDNVTAISTAGFSAGIRYSMYRAEGVASKEFRYTVRMGMPGPTFEMEVSVGGETYQMTADTSSEFYYYDVYTGTAEQLGSLAGWGEWA